MANVVFVTSVVNSFEMLHHVVELSWLDVHEVHQTE